MLARKMNDYTFSTWKLNVDGKSKIVKLIEIGVLFSMTLQNLFSPSMFFIFIKPIEHHKCLCLCLGDWEKYYL